MRRERGPLPAALVGPRVVWVPEISVSMERPAGADVGNAERERPRFHDGQDCGRDCRDLIQMQPLRFFGAGHAAVTDHRLGEFDRGSLGSSLPADAGFVSEATAANILDAPSVALLGPLYRAPELAIDQQLTY